MKIVYMQAYLAWKKVKDEKLAKERRKQKQEAKERKEEEERNAEENRAITDKVGPVRHTVCVCICIRRMTKTRRF